MQTDMFSVDYSLLEQRPTGLKSVTLSEYSILSVTAAFCYHAYVIDCTITFNLHILTRIFSYICLTSQDLTFGGQGNNLPSWIKQH